MIIHGIYIYISICIDIYKITNLSIKVLFLVLLVMIYLMVDQHTTKIQLEFKQEVVKQNEWMNE